MTDIAGDPNWLLSTVVQATAVLIGLLAVFVLIQQVLATVQKRGVELRHLEVDALVRLRTVQLNSPGDPGEGSHPDAGAGRDPALEELALLQSEADRLEAASEDLNRTRRPWFSICVLGYLAVVGILLPLTLMPARSAAFDPSAVWSWGGIELTGLTWKRLVVAGFASGLLLALLHIVWATGKNPARNTRTLGNTGS